MRRKNLNSMVGGYIDPYSGMVFPDGNLPAVYQGLKYPPIQGQNFTYGSGVTNNLADTIDITPNNYQVATAAAGSPPNPPRGPISNWFANLGTNSGWRLTSNPNSFGFGNTNGHAGLTLMGKNLAPISNALTGAYQGINALQGLSNVSKNETDRNKLLSKIKASAAGNPMLSSYLTSDQMSQLNKVRRGYNDQATATNFDFGGLIGGAGKGALMGLAGGLPGMLIGGIGGGINSLINSKNQSLTNDTEDLESLYQALTDAEAQYKRMRIPNYTGLGLQSRYTNQWM